MASFNFIEATDRGYKFLWYERLYLMRAATPVILVKLMSIFVVRLMQIEDQNLLSGLVLMPSNIVDALFVVGLVRYIAFHEPLFSFGRVIDIDNSLNVLSKNNMNVKSCDGECIDETEIVDTQNLALLARNRMFKAGVAMLLLTRVLQFGVVGSIIDYSNTLNSDMPVQILEQNTASVAVFVGVTWIILWLLRFMWLYVPLALGCSIRDFLTRIRGMTGSLSIFATWFCCNFPVMLAIYVVFNMLDPLLVPDSVLRDVIHNIIMVVGEVFMMSVQCAAMTYGFVELLTRGSGNK